MAPGLGAYRPLSSTIDRPMSRAPARFTQRDLAKVLRAAVSVGLPAKVIIDKVGRIIVEVGEGGKTDAPEVNEWDAHDQR
jgi:hypothetical protein